MLTDKSNLKSFTALNWDRQGWITNCETAAVDRWMVAEGLELSYEVIFMLLRDFRLEFEQN